MFETIKNDNFFILKSNDVSNQTQILNTNIFFKLYLRAGWHA